MGESLQLPERIATNGLRDAADRGPALPVRVGEALQALPRLETTGPAPLARTRDQRPLSCLRIDELHDSSFAGASEEAINSS